MKKLICVALVLAMVFALTVSAGAKLSPSAKDYYSITVSYEPSDGSLGTAKEKDDKDKVSKDGTGEDAQITLTATQTDGYFTMWIIDGEYDIVGDGTTSSPVLTIIPKSDINAVANFRVAEDHLTMTVKTRGRGTAKVDKNTVPTGSNERVTFTATDGEDTFTEWILECDYEIVEGSLKSRKLVIIPHTDIHATAVFVGSDSPTSTPGTANTSSTSPKTGDPLFVVLALAVLALGTGVFAVKKIKE
ncbi:MAG: hypothetical protein IJ639_01865 [Ruminococcus sp.]|nr:hypothetical protein [Ruminococcus sp.]